MSAAVKIEVQALRRRSRAAILSLLAGLSTLVIFALSFFFWNQTGPVRIWLVWIALPPVALSLAAAYQYRRGSHTGAGAAAAVVYWVMLFLLNTRAGGAYLIGAVLQTLAWYLARPRNKAT